MKARIVINMGNAAFADDYKPELARILRDIAKKLDGDWFEEKYFRHPLAVESLRDFNGQVVGTFAVRKR